MSKIFSLDSSVAEDEINIASFIKRGLEEFGYTVVTASNGEEAWGMICQESFDLLMLDIIMPQMDGLQLCQLFRQKFGYVTPILMVTALGTTDDIVAGLDAGADDYITKPFNPPILLARIGVVLKRTTDKNAEKSRGNALNMEYKGVILNVVGGCIEHEGKKTDLTKNELKILHLLYQKKVEIVPRLDMIEYLWDNEVFIDDNTLSVNVTRLRGKLADIGVTDFIETKRGMGYRI